MATAPPKIREKVEIRVEIPAVLYKWIGEESARYGLSISAFVRREMLILREKETTP